MMQHNTRPRVRMRFVRTLLMLLCVSLLSACALPSRGNKGVENPYDITAPSIRFKFLPAVGAAGQWRFEANIDDESGVQFANLYVRDPSNGRYDFQALRRSGDVYLSEPLILGASTRVQFYIVASDKVGNTVSRGSSSRPVIVSLAR